MSSASRGRKYIGLRHESVDSKIKFTIEPLPGDGDDAFDQWKEGMKAVAGLSSGIPADFRKKVWLALADNYLNGLCIDWEQTKTLAFNRKSNPDDSKLDLQIVKDLRRTGSSTFSGDENADDRAMLQRVLLAYARWNNKVGYCQGFNVIAAVILDVMERQEDCALKVMIYLIDRVLPESFFANNLRALFVDMAVFRDLLRSRLPKLSRHLDRLQSSSPDTPTAAGACDEPPLTNVFTMQWFLTLFATCLPKSTTLRVWDAVLLEGSEILLRGAVVIWGMMQRRLMAAQSADEFYTLMGILTQEMLDGNIIGEDVLIEKVYAMGTFPMPGLAELRDKYTSLGNELSSVACLAGMFPYSPQREPWTSGGESGTGEKTALDVGLLDRQYRRLMDRQKQAHIIVAGARQQRSSGQTPQAATAAATAASRAVDSSTVAVNHLFVGRDMMHSHAGKSRGGASSKSPPSSRGSADHCSSSSAKLSPKSHVSRPSHPTDSSLTEATRTEASDSSASTTMDSSPLGERERAEDSIADNDPQQTKDGVTDTSNGEVDKHISISDDTKDSERNVQSELALTTTTCSQRRQSDNPHRLSTNAETDVHLRKSSSGGDLCQTLAAPSVSSGRKSDPAMPQSQSTPRLFSPFPKQYVNKRRVDTARRLGLYTPDEIVVPTTGSQKNSSTQRAVRFQSS